MAGDLRDVRGLIPDALHVPDHLQGGGDRAQVPGHRLLLEEEAHAQALNLPLLPVNLHLPGNGHLGHGRIVVQQGRRAGGDGLLAHGPHADELLVQRLQLLVKTVSHQPNLPVM